MIHFHLCLKVWGSIPNGSFQFVERKVAVMKTKTSMKVNSGLDTCLWLFQIDYNGIWAIQLTKINQPYHHKNNSAWQQDQNIPFPLSSSPLLLFHNISRMKRAPSETKSESDINNDGENVTVLVRLRPLSVSETGSHQAAIWKILGENNVELSDGQVKGQNIGLDPKYSDVLKKSSSSNSSNVSFSFGTLNIWEIPVLINM